MKKVEFKSGGKTVSFQARERRASPSSSLNSFQLHMRKQMAKLKKQGVKPSKAFTMASKKYSR